MNEKAKEALNKAANICLFVKENRGDEQTARYMAEAIAAVNETVKCYEAEALEWEAVARAQDKAQTVMMEEIERLRAPGSASALRRALKECRDYLYDILRDALHDAQVAEQNGNPSMAGYEREQELHKEIEAAISAPARNCDVGTAEEQYKRFKKFCFDNMGDGMNEPRCSKCPLGRSKASCKFDWLQMPYAPAEGETK